MNSPNERPNPSDDAGLLTPQERSVLVAALLAQSQEDVANRRKKVLAELDAAPFCPIALQDPNNTTNPLLWCHRNPGESATVSLTLPDAHFRTQTLTGTLVCTPSENKSPLLSSTSSKKPKFVMSTLTLSGASPIEETIPDPVAADDDFAGDMLADDFEMPEELNFELHLDQPLEAFHLTAGEVHSLPVPTISPVAMEATWPSLRDRLPELPPQSTEVLDARSTVLAADSESGRKPFLVAQDCNDHVRVELFDDGKVEAWFATKASSSPIVAELSCSDGAESYYYLLDPATGKPSVGGDGVRVTRHLWTPTEPTSATVRVTVRPLTAADTCLLTQDQRHRWLGSPPLSALTVRAITDSCYRLTAFEFDLVNLAATPASVLVVRRTSRNGGAA